VSVVDVQVGVGKVPAIRRVLDDVLASYGDTCCDESDGPGCELVSIVKLLLPAAA